MSGWPKIAQQGLIKLLPPELEHGELAMLLHSGRHSLMITQRRARLIISRVRLFAFLFAVLTPIWCLVDYWVFDAPLWWQLAGLRLLASMAFAALLLFCGRDQMSSAYSAMAWLFAIPTLFYIASHTVLAGRQLSDFSQAVAIGYAFLPFVLMAGLAIFPLTLKENLLVSAVILSAHSLAGFVSWTTLSWPSFVAGTWLLVLIAGVVILAGASQLAFMLALVRQGTQDPLTGVLNRRAGEMVLQQFWQQGGRKPQPLAVAFFDLDHFKLVNDQYGHESGDQVLKQFANALSAGLRTEDALVRWGGEEFVLLMPKLSLEQAAQQIQALMQQGWGLRPEGAPLTASIGLAERLADHSEQLPALLELADQRMYLAKQQGRNRLVAQ